MVQLDRLKSVLVFIFVISTVFAVAAFAFRGNFVEIVATPEAIQAETRDFLGITVLGTPFVLLFAAAMVILQALNKRALILGMAFLNVLVRFAFDSLFFGGYAFSLGAGVIGVAWSSILASILLFAVAMYALLTTMGVSASALLAKPTFQDIRTYVGSRRG